MGWVREHGEGFGPFVSRERFRRTDGSVLTWTSREHRKAAGRLDVDRGSDVVGAAGDRLVDRCAVRDRRDLFHGRAVPGFVDAVGPHADAVVFFVGSIFFTSAAFLQFLQTVNAPRLPGDAGTATRWRFWAWEPGRIDWEASIVQLVGTVFFNVTTLAALDAALTTTQTQRLVWVPDAAGSVCFLVASWLAWSEVAHGAWSWEPRRLSWWIAGLNMVGSIAFGISAVASYIVPTTGEPRNIELVNLGTAIGGACFLVGALLLLPERTRTPRTDRTRDTSPPRAVVDRHVFELWSCSAVVGSLVVRRCRDRPRRLRSTGGGSNPTA